MNISKEKFTELAKEHLIALESYKIDYSGNKPIEIFGIEKLYEAINVIQCCVNKDLDKHPIEGVNETMHTEEDIEEIQLCGKSNCNRQKLEGNVYCSYHYDINFS